MFFTFLLTLLLKATLKHSAEVLCIVPKCKKLMMYVRKNICTYYSNTSYSAVGHEFNVNESTVY